MNEFDKRQFDIMILKIKSFKEGYLPLSELINDLEALLSVLSFQDKSWNDTFRSYWWELEEVYSFMLEEEKTIFTPEDKKIIDDAVQHLKKMIELKLDFEKK